MFYNIKMKLLIGGKSRSIYMRKDGSAYYKSGGENVDVSYMFKKNGGGLKKQYIGGVQDNLGKVEQKKRSKKGVKQILGGVVSNIKFDDIEINSEKLVKDDIIPDNEAKKELEKLCYIALNGLSINSNELQQNDDKDKVKISIANTLEKFKEYVDNNIVQATRSNIYGDAADAADAAKVGAITNDFAKDSSELKKLGFTGIDFTTDGITVTRAYVLNKILQCFDGDTPLATTALNDNLKSNHSRDVLTNKSQIINPQTGKFEASANFEQILDNIVNVLKLSVNEDTTTNDLHIRVRNLHQILFMNEKIGAPAAAPAAADNAGDDAD
jgi:hypothetical protein